VDLVLGAAVGPVKEERVISYETCKMNVVEYETTVAYESSDIHCWSSTMITIYRNQKHAYGTSDYCYK